MKSITFFATLLFIIVLAIFAQSLNKDKQQRREYQFDIVNDSTIIISDDGEDWETISSDSLTYYLIDNNQ